MSRSRRRLLMFGLLLSLLVVLIFIGRAVRHAPRPSRDEPIRPWMSVTYVARAYRTPPPVLLDALGIPLSQARQPLSAIAAAQGRPVTDLIAALQQAIADYRSTHSSSQPPPLDPAAPQPALADPSGLRP